MTPCIKYRSSRAPSHPQSWRTVSSPRMWNRHLGGRLISSGSVTGWSLWLMTQDSASFRAEGSCAVLCCAHHCGAPAQLLALRLRRIFPSLHLYTSWRLSHINLPQPTHAAAADDFLIHLLSFYFSLKKGHHLPSAGGSRLSAPTRQPLSGASRRPRRPRRFCRRRHHDETRRPCRFRRPPPRRPQRR